MIQTIFYFIKCNLYRETCRGRKEGRRTGERNGEKEGGRGQDGGGERWREGVQHLAHLMFV